MTRTENTNSRKNLLLTTACVSMTALAVFFMPATPAQARDQIHIVGSSTGST